MVIKVMLVYWQVIGYLFTLFFTLCIDQTVRRYVVIPNMAYSRDLLFRIGNQCKSTPPVLSDECITNIYCLGIEKRRGYGSTHLKSKQSFSDLILIPTDGDEQCPIPSFSNVRKYALSTPKTSVNEGNLLSVRRHAKPNSKLRCASINARSVRNKATLLNHMMIDHKLDVFCIQETWLGKTDDDAVIAELLPEGYDFRHVPRVDKNGGGVAIAYRSNIRVDILEDDSYKTFEKLEALVTVDNKSVRIISVYRSDPHGINVSKFMEEFAEYILTLSVKSDQILLCGDLNLHLDEKDHPDIQSFISLLNCCGLRQIVKEPTHRGNHILDTVIVSNVSSMPLTASVSDHGISDHYLVSFSIKGVSVEPIRKTVSSRNFKEVDMSAFKKDILDNVSISTESVAEAAETYDNSLTKILDNHAPVQTKSVLIRPNTRWITDNVRHAKTIRRRYERRKNKTNSPEAKLAYAKQCEIVNNLVTRAKTEFNSNRVLESQHDQKRLFNVTKDILRWNNPATFPDNIDEGALPQVFLDFFIDKVIKIRNDVSYQQRNIIFQEIRQNLSPDMDMDIQLSEFTPTTVKEITDIVKKAPSSSCLLDPLPTHMVKESIDELAPILTQIVNLSLTNSTVPDSLKKSIVVPLLKKSNLDKNILKNFRPVSNLSFASKLIERVVARRINDHLMKHALLDKYQSAYRAFHSTETALLRVQNDILQALNNKKVVALVMLDLSAAFDTIDHQLLFERLQSLFKITDSALLWIKSYLSDREQVVRISHFVSNTASVNFGVPQGSVLGPILFSMYVTPLASITSKYGLCYHFYADDSQLYVSFNPRVNFQSSIQNLENCISEIRCWMCCNMLKLNDDKTEFIVFGSKYSMSLLESRLHVTIGETQITAVDSVRNLGALFDKYATMDEFVNCKIKSCMYYIRNINRIRKFLTCDATKTLMQAFVISRLDYANSLLFGINKVLMYRLQLVQNLAAKVIYRSSWRDHVTPLLKELHYLPMMYRPIFKILVLVHKCIYGNAPLYLSDLLYLYSSGRSLRSENQCLLQVSRTNNKYGDRAFANCGPRLWNELPFHTRKITCLRKFKVSLKTHLFKKAYGI